MKKKILATFLSVAMLLTMGACGNNSTGDGGAGGGAGGESLAGTYDVVIWAPEAAIALTQQQVTDFNSSNTDGITINVTVEPVSESEAVTTVVTDVEAAADLYFFAQDQFSRAVQAGALSKLGTSAAASVTAANDPGVVSAAKSGDEMYAYPLTSDNGYFMYYDKSVIPDADVDSLEALIADCEAAGKYFAFEMDTSAWYLASFFFATGCVSEWVTDDDGTFISVNDTFNSPQGLIAAKGMKKLVDSPMHLSSSSGAEFASGAAIVVTGTWDYTTVQEILGDNMGVADLPSFEVDGKSYHLGSYNGCKLLGVKPQTDAVKSAVLHKLAQYLTDEAHQMERFETLAWGPANLAAQQSEEVKANPALSALFEQNAYSIPQGQIHGSWWDLAKVIGTDVKAATNDAGIQAALDSYTDKMNALFNLSDEVKNAFTVIGSIGGDTWSIDIPMTEANGVWTTEALALKAGEEFKVRQGLSWDAAYPADNFVVEADGTYQIQFDSASETVSLIPN